MKVGDIGTELFFIIKDQDNNIVDLSGAESANLIINLGGNKVTKTCVFGDKLKGEVLYTTIEGDLFTSGDIKMEVNIKFLDGDEYTTEIVRDEVDRRL